MRRNPTKKIEKHRVLTGQMASTAADGANGAFLIPGPSGQLTVLASDGTDWQASGLPGAHWEHVSVSTRVRCPTWEEMDFVKRIFWRDDETVIQLHVPGDDHISYHDFCLHLWKPPYEIKLPPSITVGPSDAV